FGSGTGFRRKRRIAAQRFGENFLIVRSLDFGRPELPQMLGHELSVEQSELRRAQQRHEMHQRYLGCIPLMVEHALAEKRASEPDAVKPADQLSFAPGFDGMTMAALE